MAKTRIIDGHTVRIVGRVCDIAVDHVIPHERNGHHPHLLRKTALALIAGMLVVTKALLVVAPLVLPSHSVFSSAITVQNIIKLTNAERAAYDLPVLKTASQLSLAAQKKAKDMADNGYFAHRSPTGQNMRDFIQSTGYQYDEAGENLAMKFLDAEHLTEAWILSASHRQNLLSSMYDETGVGIAQGRQNDEPVIYVVQYFAHRSKASKEATAIKAASLTLSNPPPAMQKVVSEDFVAATSSGSVLSDNDIASSTVMQTGEVTSVFAPTSSEQSERDVLGIPIRMGLVNDMAEQFYIAVIALLTGLLFVLMTMRAQALHVRLMAQVYSVVFIGVLVLFI